MTAIEYRNEGYRIFNGEGCEPDPIRGREMFLKAFELGDAPSASFLGSIAYDDDDYKSAFEWFTKACELFYKAGSPEEDKGLIAYAKYLMGTIRYFNYEGKEEPMKSLDRQMGALHLIGAYEMGNTECRELLGLCYYNGDTNPHGMPEYNNAFKVWKEGMEDGDQVCAMRFCISQVEQNQADETTVAILEGLVNDPDNPCADACAVLYQYYSIEDNDDMAVKWMERGLEMDSALMRTMLDDEREQEVGEDSYTAQDPLTAPCVIVVDTNGDFRVEQADASDWDSLPELIGADRTDNMRCTKFREVSAALGLNGTLLGLLDRDAFRKSDLEPNWHASQWYDGMADLYGDMIICLEDSGYNPFSFSGEAEAQRVIEALTR